MFPARRALVVGSLVALASLLLPVSPAVAHADYRASTPSDGATVSSPPSSVRAEFTEPPADGSTLKIYDPCGVRVDSGSYSYEGFPINSMTVGMSADKAGEYEAEWTVVSEADGHTTRGTFTFTSSGGDPCPGSGANEGDEGGSRSSGRTKSSGPSTGSEDDSSASARAEAGRGAGGDGSAGAERSRSDKKRSRSPGNSDPKASDGEDTITLTQADEPPPSRDDLPLDWLVVGLSISALIGAIGGRIYANILGPR